MGTNPKHLENKKKDIWSSTDFPHQCLIDIKRTKKLQEAIKSIVKPEDVVLDVGAGSGILSFFAAKANAKKVISVEYDPILAKSLRESIIWNELEGIVEVLEGNVFDQKLSRSVDVLIAEIIDTAFIDEQFVPVINFLWEQKVIDKHTKIIPQGYKTYIQLVNADLDFYGFKIAAPQHVWPHYSYKKAGWWQTKIIPVSQNEEVIKFDFTKGKAPMSVEKEIIFKFKNNMPANAIRISGILKLTDKLKLGATNALNGDKILPIEPYSAGNGKLTLKIAYTHAGGLESFKWKI